MGCLFSKPTNSCHPKKFLFWSVLNAVYWISCFSPSWFMPLCWWNFQGKGSWEIYMLRSCMSGKKKISFHPHTFTFGHKANLGKNICQSESSGCFSNVFKLPVLLPTNLKPVWFTILCDPPPRCSEISQWCVFLVWVFFTYCAEYMKTTFNLETNILQYCKFKIFLLSVFSI